MKIDGERAYALRAARRRGGDAAPPFDGVCARRRRVRDDDTVTLDLRVSSGTYVRAIARRARRPLPRRCAGPRSGRSTIDDAVAPEAFTPECLLPRRTCSRASRIARSRERRAASGGARAGARGPSRSARSTASIAATGASSRRRAQPGLPPRSCHVRPAPAHRARQPRRAALHARAAPRAARGGRRRGRARRSTSTSSSPARARGVRRAGPARRAGVEVRRRGRRLPLRPPAAAATSTCSSGSASTCARVPLVDDVSSSRIRQLLAAGDVVRGGAAARPAGRGRGDGRARRPARRHARLPDREPRDAARPARADARHLRRLGARAPRRDLDRHEPALRRHRAAGRGATCSTSTATSTGSGSSSSSGSGCATRRRSSSEAELVAAIAERRRAHAAPRGRPTRASVRSASFRRAAASSLVWKRHRARPEAVCSPRERPLPRVRRGLLEAGRRRHGADEPGLPRVRLRRLDPAQPAGRAAAHRAAPPRVGGGPAPPDRADAAEVVVPLGPAPHGAPAPPRAPRARPRRRPARRSRRRRRGGRAAGRRRPAARGPRRGSRRRRRRARCAAACRPRRRSRARGRRRRARGSAPSCSASGRPARAAPWSRSASPSMLFRCRSRPGSQSPEPRPRLVVSTQALPSASTVTRFVVCVSGPAPPSSASTSATHALRAARARAARGSRASVAGTPESPPRREEPARRATASRPARSSAARTRRGRRAVRSPPRSSREREQRRRRSCRCTRRPRLRRRATRARRRGPAARARSPGSSSVPPGAYMRAPSRIVITGSSIARHATCAGGIATPSRASRSAGSTSRAPRQPAVRAPQRAEPGGHAGHGARRRADRVVHELRAERHLELEQLRLARRRAEPGHRAEAVEVARRAGRRVEVDRVAAAEQPGHHRLGDARREARRDGGVGGRAAVGEDLGAGRRRRRMPGRDAGAHAHADRGSATQPMRADAGAREVEPVAHQPAAREAVDAAADRPRRQPRPRDRRAGDRIGLALLHDESSPAPRRRLASSSAYRPAASYSVSSAGRVPGSDPGRDAAPGSEPELLDDAADEPAAAPAVRQHRERELLLRHEQEQRLVAGDRALVVERGAAAGVAHPPAERVAARRARATARGSCSSGRPRRRGGARRSAAGRRPSTRARPTAGAPPGTRRRSRRGARTRRPARGRAPAPPARRSRSPRARAARARASRIAASNGAARTAPLAGLPVAGVAVRPEPRRRLGQRLAPTRGRSPAVWLRQRAQLRSSSRRHAAHERRRERLRDRRDPKRRLRPHRLVAPELEHAVGREHGLAVAQKPAATPGTPVRCPRVAHRLLEPKPRIHAGFATLPADPVPARRCFFLARRAEARETTTEEAQWPSPRKPSRS